MQEFKERGYFKFEESELSDIISNELDIYLESLFPNLGKSDRFRHLDSIGYTQRKSSLRAFTLSGFLLPHLWSEPALALYAKLGVNSPTLEQIPVTHFLSPQAVQDAHIRSSQAKLITPPHQDAVVTMGSKNQIVFFVVPRCSSKASLKLWPGSHIHGVLPWQEDPFSHSIVDIERLGPPKDVQVNPGELLAFSSYLAHSTNLTGDIRLALSWRVDDLSDSDWKLNAYSRESPKTLTNNRAVMLPKGFN